MRCTAVVALLFALPTPAAAILPDDGGDGLHPAVTACHGGQVWHGPSGGCVDPESGAVPDDTLFAAMRSLAHAGRYRDALRLLHAMSERGTPRVLTAEGYLLRRTGRVAEGLALYDQALALDPDYHLARAYLGMWHLSQGNSAAARRQLAQIEARGGLGSEGWQVLSEALETNAAGY